MKAGNIMRTRELVFALALGATMALCACGDRASSSSSEETTASAGEEGGVDPCKLLTKEQADKLVPESDGGSVAHAGGSLIKGVDSYQCSYINRSMKLLTVIWHDAVDDARFEEIKPDFSLIGSAQKVDVGERAWMVPRDDRVKVTAVQGRTKIEVELSAPGAKAQSDDVLAAARAVAAKLRERK